MDSESLRDLLEAVRSGRVEVEAAAERISQPPFVDTPHARIDTQRGLRQGIPEVVYGAGKTPEQIVEHLYLRCLTRKPTEKETEALKDLIVDEKAPLVALQDFYWALLNSREFLFNH